MAKKGPAATYWSNVNHSGDPAGAETGVGNVTGYLDFTWAGAPLGLAQSDGWSARYEGLMQFPNTGSYTFRIISDEAVRMWIGDDLYLAGSTGGTWESDPYSGSAATKRHLRIDFADVSGSASLELEVRYPGSAVWIPPSSPTTTGSPPPP